MASEMFDIFDLNSTWNLDFDDENDDIVIVLSDGEECIEGDNIQAEIQTQVDQTMPFDLNLSPSDNEAQGNSNIHHQLAEFDLNETIYP